MSAPGLAPIFIKGDWNLGDLRLQERGFDDHLDRKFHPGATHLQPLVECLGKSSQPAIDIMNWGGKPDSRQETEHGIAPPAVKERHRIRHDLAASFGEPATLS